jgi:hypothetical protein
MKYKDGTEPAYPEEYKSFNDHGVEIMNYIPGLTRRDYACIKLKVPKTDKAWLNEIILESKRDELAGQAMAAIIIGNDASEDVTGEYGSYGTSEDSYMIADSILEAKGK